MANKGNKLVGGPMGGPGRPGKPVMTPQQASGDYGNGPGVASNPFRGVPPKKHPRRGH